MIKEDQTNGQKKMLGYQAFWVQRLTPKKLMGKDEELDVTTTMYVVHHPNMWYL